MNIGREPTFSPVKAACGVEKREPDAEFPAGFAQSVSGAA